MKANDNFIIAGCILIAFFYIVTIVQSFIKEKEYKEQIQKQEAIIGIMSDCIHNMIDNYGDEDDIYNNYINIAYEEANITEEEFVNYSYCY